MDIFHVNCLVFACIVELAYLTDEVHNHIFNSFYVLVIWSCVTDDKKCHKQKEVLTLCMAYDSEAIKGIATKHRELLYGPSAYNRLKY